MIHRGVAGAARVRVRLALLVLVAALAATVLVARVGGRAEGDGPSRCDRFAADSAARAAEVSGSGDGVLVIGDSYSVGLGLDRPESGWTSRLPGRVHVAGFSGSGFSRDASPCGDVSFASRAPEAVRRSGAALVVVEGGLNDWDRTPAEIEAGFTRLMSALAGHDVVVVGPVSAPARADRVPAVDAQLARLSAAHDATYVSVVGLELPYLDDELHLTAAGHAALGEFVADRLR